MMQYGIVIGIKIPKQFFLMYNTIHRFGNTVYYGRPFHSEKQERED